MNISKKSTIANNIEKHREKLGVSQDRLSKLADVTYHTIIKIRSVENLQSQDCKSI